MIVNRLGLHARASAKLTKLASSFGCQVWMSRGDRRINAKSIMGVMMLAAGMGTEVEVETDGVQEEAAMQALLALIADKFGEGEWPCCVRVFLEDLRGSWGGAPQTCEHTRPRSGSHAGNCAGSGCAGAAQRCQCGPLSN